MKRLCPCNENNNIRYFEKIILNKLKDTPTKVVVIPIIFHICYEIVSPNVNDVIMSDINYTIEMLNKDFSMTNSNFKYGQSVVNSYKNTYPYNLVKNMYTDALKNVKDSNIRFVYSSHKYVNIKPSTFINKYGSDQSGVETFILEKSPPVNQDQNLNVWVVPLTDLLGFANFPWNTNDKVNGVVINYKTYGKNKNNLYPEFALNKTMTHEIGHWMGLLHTFQDYNLKPSIGIQQASIDYEPGKNDQESIGDCVIDTPPQKTPTFGDPLKYKTYNYRSMITNYKNKLYCPMFVNYMDYSDDICMFMFTDDQIVKMRLFIQMYKPKIYNNGKTYKPAISKPKKTQIVTNNKLNISDKSNWIVVNDNIIKSLAINYCCYNSRRIINVDKNTKSVLITLIPQNPNTYVGMFKDGMWTIKKIPKSDKITKEVLPIQNATQIVIGTCRNSNVNTKIISVNYENNFVNTSVGTIGATRNIIRTKNLNKL